MANWSNILITVDGASKLANAIAGDSLEFTRIAIGDDKQAGNASLVTSMKNEVAHTSPVTVKATGNKVNIRGAFLSQFLTTSFYMKEIGLFALIRSSLGVPGPEFLIAYGTALDTNGDWIDALSPNTSIERVFEFAITISTDASVSVAIEPLALATKADIIDFLKIEDLQGYLKIEDLQDGNKSLNITKLDASRVVAGRVDVAQIRGIDSGVVLYVKTSETTYSAALIAKLSAFADKIDEFIHTSMTRLHVSIDAYIENMRSPSLASGCCWSYNSVSNAWSKVVDREFGAIPIEMSSRINGGAMVVSFTFPALKEDRGLMFTSGGELSFAGEPPYDGEAPLRGPQTHQTFLSKKNDSSVDFVILNWTASPPPAPYVSFFIM